MDSEATVVRSNRAEVYLRLNYYSGAAYDAQRVLSAGGVPAALSDKAFFRLAKAQYGRGEYAASEENFARWHARHPEDPAAAPWIARCQARRTESLTGEYAFASLFREAAKEIRLDVADYMGPIEMKQMTNRGGGRGVVAKRDIRTGELLVRRPSPVSE